MADLPFKINIETEAGKQYSYFDADFADTSDTAISSSVILTRINALASQSYSDSEAAGTGHSGFHLFNNSYNDWITASVVGSTTSGSISFTHTDGDDSGDRLKRYKFYGTKVCNVLGLPAGQWNYPANFQLDDSGGGENYFSGDVSANSLSVARSISFSPISSVAGNIRFNIDKSVDKFIQFTSGSQANQVNKLMMGYNTDENRYEITGANYISTGQYGSIRSHYIHNDNYNVWILGGRTTPSESDYNHGQLIIGEAGANRMICNLKISHSGTTTWDTGASDNEMPHYTLTLSNRGMDSTGAFSGIAFDACTANDPDAIMASIAAVRDVTANGDDQLHDGNLCFATNDLSDDDLTERMRITHDGLVGIGSIDPSYGLHVVGTIGATSNITAYASDKRLKENVKTIESPLEKVLSLEGVTFNWNELAEKEAGFDREEGQVGLLAQDLQKILPEAVKLAPFDKAPDSGGSISGENYLTIQYEGVVPLLVESIKEMGSLIGDLESRIKQLENKE